LFSMENLKSGVIGREKFLARVSKKGFKDMLTRVIQAPNNSEVLNLTMDEGKRKNKVKKQNTFAFEKLIFSIDMSKDKGKIVFWIVKSNKNAEKKGEDVALAWK